jgi:hypothetical protein
MELKDLETFLKTDEGKTFLQKKLDSAVSIGVNTYKTKFEKEELPGLIDTAVQERHPAMTDSEKRIKELEVQFLKSEKQGKRSDVSARLIRYASEKEIPQFLVDVSIGEDYDKSVTTLDTYNTRFNETLSAEVEKRISGRKGPVRNSDDTAPIDLNNLPLNDPDFYEKNFEKLEEMLKKDSN